MGKLLALLPNISLTFMSKAGAHPSGAPYGAPLYGKATGLTHKY